MEEVVVVRARSEDAVLQEREGADVGGAEGLADEPVAAVEQSRRSRCSQPRSSCAAGRAGAARRARARRSSAVDRVGRELPDVVEPLDEDVDLGAAAGLGRPERRIGTALLRASSRSRIESATTSPWSVSSTGHEILAGERDDGRAVVGRRRRPSRRGSTCGPRASATRSTLVEYGMRWTRISLSRCTGRGRSCGPGRPRRRARAGAAGTSAPMASPIATATSRPT